MLKVVTADAIKIHKRGDAKEQLTRAIESGSRSQGGSNPEKHRARAQGVRVERSPQDATAGEATLT